MSVHMLDPKVKSSSEVFTVGHFLESKKPHHMNPRRALPGKARNPGFGSLGHILVAALIKTPKASEVEDDDARGHELGFCLWISECRGSRKWMWICHEEVFYFKQSQIHDDERNDTY